MERASILVEKRTDKPARTTVADAIGGKARYARIAIDCLVREGYLRGAKREGLARSGDLIGFDHKGRGYTVLE